MLVFLASTDKEFLKVSWRSWLNTVIMTLTSDDYPRQPARQQRHSGHVPVPQPQNVIHRRRRRPRCDHFRFTTICLHTDAKLAANDETQ